MPVLYEELLSEARGLLPDAVALRRTIHENPELGLDLPETRARVLESLSDLDLEIAQSVHTSGLIATLRGQRPGPTILLRADMDALPMPEDTGLEFASRHPGRMHACGHDAHTAMLATAARLLHRHRGEIRGHVKLMFQPGEEGHFGALRMIEEGMLDVDPVPAAAFAIHIDPRVPCGRVASRAGPLLAATDYFSVTILGRGGHASMPHHALDPVQIACEIVLALQSFVTRRINAFDPAVLTVSQIHSGTTNNVVPESAELGGTFRTVSPRARELVGEGLRRVAERVAEAHGAEARVEIESKYPVTVNHQSFIDFARVVTDDVLGPSAFIEMPSPIMGGEDFSYLLERMEGAMVFLGLRPSGVNRPEPCHSNRMVIDEDGMAAGIALHVAVALRWLDQAA